MMPPPQTIVMKMPEAAAVYTPSPDVARLKMAPHMTDVASPQSIRKSRLMRTGFRSERKVGAENGQRHGGGHPLQGDEKADEEQPQG